MATEARPGPDGSTDALRRVKEVEGELDSRLRRLRETTALELSRSREEAEAAVRAAQVAAEGARDEALTNARRRADEEAGTIVAAGEEEARRIAEAPPADLTKLRARVLGAVFEGFLGEKED